jgi:uncharacterized protein
MSDKIEVVTAAYDAFGCGDIERVLDLISEVEWTEAAGMPYGGTYRGGKAVLENVFSPLGGDVRNFVVRPDELLPVDDDRVLAIGTYRGDGENGAVNVRFAHLWTVRGNKIARFEQFADTHTFRQAVGK